MTTQIKKILDESGMTLADFAGALGINQTSLMRMVTGRTLTPDGVIADAMAVLDDIDAVDELIAANPWIQKVSYKVFKLVLDQPAD
jgi:predicted transcriptional regulator